jgi:IS30 family transposase
LYTLTSDNGKEFAEHEEIAKALKADFFFAHPYAAWERGSNENMNGLIRHYIPKKCDFSSIGETEVELVMDRLNNRPRKCLGFMSPLEKYFDLSVALQS